MRQFQKNGEEFMSALLLGTIKSYLKTYSRDILEEKLLTELIDPDARKVDLLYRGLITTFATAAYPEENWNKIFGKKNSTIETINQILYLKPNVMGIGININNVINILKTGYDERKLKNVSRNKKQMLNK
jgi:hypothetical protein